MLRLRRLIGIVALLGVLMHAGALVRHNGTMLNALLQYQGLVAALTAMCHGSGSAADVDLPYLPKPSGVEFGCPVCSCLVAAFALAAPEPAEIVRAPQHPLNPPERLAGTTGSHRLGLPPARGPPALA